MSRHGKFAEGTARINFTIPTADKEILRCMAQEDERTLSAFCKRHLLKLARSQRAQAVIGGKKSCAAAQPLKLPHPNAG